MQKEFNEIMTDFILKTDVTLAEIKTDIIHMKETDKYVIDKLSKRLNEMELKIK